MYLVTAKDMKGTTEQTPETFLRAGGGVFHIGHTDTRITLAEICTGGVVDPKGLLRHVGKGLSVSTTDSMKIVSYDLAKNGCLLDIFRSLGRDRPRFRFQSEIVEFLDCFGLCPNPADEKKLMAYKILGEGWTNTFEFEDVPIVVDVVLDGFSHPGRFKAIVSELLDPRELKYENPHRFFFPLRG